MVWSGVLLLMLHFVPDFEKVPSHKVHFHMDSGWTPGGLHLDSAWTPGGLCVDSAWSPSGV